MLTWTSNPSRTGTWMLPKSIRSASGTSSFTSQGPLTPGSSGSSQEPLSGSSGSSPAACAQACSSSSLRRRRNTASSLMHYMSTGRPEPAVPARGAGQGLDLMEYRAGHLLDDELGNPVPSPEPDRLSAVGVEQGHLDLATVPGIDRAWRIDNGDPVPGSEPGAGVDEGRVPVRQGDRDPGGHYRPLPRGQRDVHRREQVHARIAGVRPGGQRQLGVQALDEDLHGLRGHGGDPTPAGAMFPAGGLFLAGRLFVAGRLFLAGRRRLP